MSNKDLYKGKHIRIEDRLIIEYGLDQNYTYRTFEEANIAIFKYIEGWYNRKRLHSSINYMTPDQCELIARSAA